MPTSSELASAGAGAARGRHLLDLVVHLAGRRLASQHRFTVLGWMWPVARQLAQLAVLVFLFGSVLDLGIENFPLFVFTGLMAWTWFSSAISTATTVLRTERHLVFSPRFPTIALPLVCVAVTLIDALMALPVLAVMLAAQDELHLSVVALPAVLALQFVLCAGVALIASACNVFFRDVQNLVSLGLLLLFYLTPVFYGLKNVPERFQGLLEANPLTPLLDCYRAVLLDGRAPDAADAAQVAVVAAVLAVAGWAVFRRLEPDFVDEL